MATLKSAEIERYLRAPDPRHVVTLIYGPDTGLVSERCAAFAARVVTDPKDPFQAVKLEGDALASDPLRLADEANTVSLFGGRRLIWVRAGSKQLGPALEPLLRSPPRDAAVLVEAGDLGRSSPLRAVLEKAACAVAIPCYLPDARDSARFVETEFAALNLSITADAKEAVTALVGGDRLASRAEIQKIALYAHPEKRITIEHVDAVCGDASATAIDEAVDATFAGQPAAFVRAFGRLVGEGQRGDVILGSALRQALVLMAMRREIDEGKRVEDLLVRVHFKRKAAVERQLKRWSTASIGTAISSIGDALAGARKDSDLATLIAERCLLSLSMIAARARG